MKVRISPAIIVLIASCTLFCGCGADNTHMSKQEIANFHGGPMPPGAAAELARRQIAMQNSEPPAYKAWLAQRQAALAAKRGSSAAAPPQASQK